MSDVPTIRIAPSLLSADFACLREQIELIERAGADLLHLDIMDGHFAPNLSFGVPVVEAISNVTDLFLDTHLMIADPERYARPFVEAGASSITFHIEVVDHPRETVKRLRELGVKLGVALNPSTPVEAVLEVVEDVDIVLVMAVQPGFGGQRFRIDCLDKIATLADLMSEEQWLEVDGGVNLETARLAVAAGADTLVAGHAIFRSDDPIAAVAALRAAALHASAAGRKR